MDRGVSECDDGLAGELEEDRALDGEGPATQLQLVLQSMPVRQHPRTSTGAGDLHRQTPVDVGVLRIPDFKPQGKPSTWHARESGR